MSLLANFQAAKRGELPAYVPPVVINEPDAPPIERDHHGRPYLTPEQQRLAEAPDHWHAFPGRLCIRVYGDRSGATVTAQDDPMRTVTRSEAAELIRRVRVALREAHAKREAELLASMDNPPCQSRQSTADTAPDAVGSPTIDAPVETAESPSATPSNGDSGTGEPPTDDGGDSGDGADDPPRDLFYPPSRDKLPAGALIAVGQRIYWGCHGGMYGIVHRINGEQRPQTIGQMGGGCVVYGGNATIDALWDNGTRSQATPESIVRGVQWEIFASVATTDEVIDAMNYVKASEFRRALDADEAERLAAEELARDMATEGTIWMTGAELKAKAPSGTTRVIVACIDENTSDSMTDYYAHRTTRSVVIGFSSLKRESFSVLRKAAALFPHTAHLAPGRDRWRVWLCWDHSSTDTAAKAGAWLNYDSYYKGDSLPDHFWMDKYGFEPYSKPPTFATEAEVNAFMAANPPLAGCKWQQNCTRFEHRENYSMGGGNYLKDGHDDSDGWRVESQLINYLADDARYQFFAPQTAEKPEAQKPTTGITVTLNAAKSGIEIRFASKPAATVLDSLKSHGWRWSRFGGCWYAKDTPAARRFAEAVSGGALPATTGGIDVDRVYEDQCRDACGL